MLTIKEQPNYQDFTQDQPPINLTAQEFFDLSEPSNESTKITQDLFTK